MKIILLGLVLMFCSIGLFAQDMTLYSPTNYQVFQRQTKSVGYILVSGKTSSDKINCKIIGKNYQDKEIIIEKTIKPDKYGAFKADIETPAGGWYRLQLRYGNDGFKEIDCVGVGEVIISAGQSNASNASSEVSKQESGMVSSTDGVIWKYGDDPQIGIQDGSIGGSFYPALGDALYKEFHVPIGFAPTPWGGSEAERWQPGAGLELTRHKLALNAEGKWMPVQDKLNGQTDMYSYFMKRVYQFGNKGFRCVIWHQGESNVGNETDFFYNLTVNIIESSRKDAGWYIPWFVAKVSYHGPHMRGDEKVRAAFQRIWDNKIAFEGPDTDTLQEEYRDFEGKGIHLSLKGIKKHGEMWAEFLIPYIHSEID
ncbi:MAG: hypothetical protein IJS60_00915 [Abditibacteriota bacterium]|nr:hypothetical protein [Abditibacteriota bacterium]